MALDTAIVPSATLGEPSATLGASLSPDDHGSDAPALTAPQQLKAQVRLFAQHCAQFRTPDTRLALAQILTTAVPFVALVALMIYAANGAYWLTLLLAIPAGGLLVRFFIIQHDCAHGSFLKSQVVNDWLGRSMSVLTMTAYGLWRREHALHHSGSSNLERRGVGDIETLTVEEYLKAGWFERVRYRIYRNPFFLFGFGVPFYFMILQRLPFGHALPARDCWRSVTCLNAVLLVIYGLIGAAIGYLTLLKVMVPIVFVASAIGGWLFFIQHQFEETRWWDAKDWDFQTAAVYGSSYYVLPKVLQWFTGNIGLHHIHHLNAMIPNYRLQECMDALPLLATINRLTLRESFGCVRLALWDASGRRLIGFGDLKRLPQAA